jgi:hypothetical protein
VSSSQRGSLVLLFVVVLMLNSNSFASTISENVGMLTNLELFDINDNFFEGTLPETLGRMSHLREYRRR